MTIDKAIEILQAVTKGGKLITDSEQREASQLGSEALKLEIIHRRNAKLTSDFRLPGETEGE